ncbi:hypothetical protein VTL71DRAFT_16137 [Oculimacula yallundae]|uniref:Uncharacterized protein n=1 Tax=Oculimacula yallundae TaxID=86028 RepID=A0ABR4CDL5_9HELO
MYPQPPLKIKMDANHEYGSPSGSPHPSARSWDPGKGATPDSKGKDKETFTPEGWSNKPIAYDSAMDGDPVELPEPPPLWFEHLMKLQTAVMIHNEPLTIGNQADLTRSNPRVLPWSTITPTYSEDNLRSHVVLSFVGKRVQDPPRTAITQEESLWSRSTFPSGTQLATPTCYGQPVKFTVAVMRDSLHETIIQQLASKLKSDKVNDPMLRWIKSSPNAQQLTLGNIFAVHEQPVFKQPGFVAAEKKLLQDSDEHVYGLRRLEEANCATSYRGYPLKLVLSFNVPACPVYTGDDVLRPRIIGSSEDEFNEDGTCHLSGDGGDGEELQERPTKAQRTQPLEPILFPKDVESAPDSTKVLGSTKPLNPSSGQTDFRVIGCYVAVENPNPGTGKLTGFPFEGRRTTAFEAGDVDEINVSANPKADQRVRDDLTTEARLEKDAHDLHCWTGVVQRVDASTPESTLPVMTWRPLAFRFRGPVGKYRSVATDIPTIETRMQNVSRYYAEIGLAQRNEIRIEQNFSDQTKKDLFRCLDLAHKLNPAQAHLSAQNYLVQYTINYDERLQFPTQNYIEKYCGSDWPSITQHLLPNQRDALEMVESYGHGYIHINGTVASAKSEISQFLVVGGLSNSHPGAKFTALEIRESNQGVDELVLNLQRLCAQHEIKNHLIIRLRPSATEKSKFVGGKITSSFYESLAAMTEEAAKFSMHHTLYNAARSADKKKKHGDKRFTDPCRNHTLYAAMSEKLEAEKSTNAVYMLISTTLRGIVLNPANDQYSIKNIAASIKILLRDTLQSASVVVATATPGQALRTILQAAIPKFTVMLLDEGGKRSLAVTHALHGAYDFDTLIENADIRQGAVLCYTNTA